MNDCFGCIIKFTDKEASNHQPHFLKNLKTKFESLTKGLHSSKLAVVLGLNLMMPKENEEPVDIKKYHDHRSGVGILLYLTKHTRTDIANAIHEHSKDD